MSDHTLLYMHDTHPFLSLCFQACTYGLLPKHHQNARIQVQRYVIVTVVGVAIVVSILGFVTILSGGCHNPTDVYMCFLFMAQSLKNSKEFIIHLLPFVSSVCTHHQLNLKNILTI